jgi:hypothetical protein
MTTFLSFGILNSLRQWHHFAALRNIIFQKAAGTRPYTARVPAKTLNY